MVRAGHRPQRRHRQRAARHHRAARPERRRQEHVHEAHYRPAQAEQGRRQGARRADLGQPETVLPHRVLSRAGRLLRPDDRTGVGDGARPPQRLRRSGGQGRGRAGADDRRSDGRRQQAHRRLQQGHAAARQARAGARPRSRAAHPRRAAVGHGSEGPPQDDSADSRVGQAGQEHHRLEPHPARDRIDDVEHPADQQRADPGGGQRPPDSRSHRRASAHGVHPRPRIRAASRASSWTAPT